MRNLKVIMAYKGTAYHGFQRQENALTVQEVVEKHVSKVLNHKAAINGCSRTDTGVHANNYCFSVMTESSIPVKGFVRGVNGELPDDISILSCEDAPLDFHARFSCRGKEYIYLIHNSESKNPFAKDLAYHYRRPFDAPLVRSAAERFLGTHDFAAFCSNYDGISNTVRTIEKFDIEINGESVKILVKGDGFLYNMIRIMIGTLLTVNEGYIKPERIDEILKSRDRQLAGRTAQSHGLYLNRVFY
ncbi:MAG: tRNA pseudouridine(38-40) synthase TruA [Clostridium sp.]|nr:tRNA pseudouridine(38-40) synthase TruA [Clostridium sp.]MCM1547404.1 tRNA pseudouridine(38-40) synthase TruA [Ruminococcus sp.]